MFSIDEDDQDLDDTLVALTTALRTTAASYCGFQLTILENHSPVILSAFTDGQDGPVGTSLRLPLGLVSSVDGDSRVVFFAGNPGAFTDLAADLSHALGGIPIEQQSPAADGMDLGGTHMDGHRKAIELDVDCISDGETSIIGGMLEHIEYAGVHSGDAAMVMPPHTLSKDMLNTVRKATYELARELRVLSKKNAGMIGS